VKGKLPVILAIICQVKNGTFNAFIHRCMIAPVSEAQVVMSHEHEANRRYWDAQSSGWPNPTGAPAWWTAAIPAPVFRSGSSSAHRRG